MEYIFFIEGLNNYERFIFATLSIITKKFFFLIDYLHLKLQCLRKEEKRVRRKKRTIPIPYTILNLTTALRVLGSSQGDSCVPICQGLEGSWGWVRAERNPSHLGWTSSPAPEESGLSSLANTTLHHTLVMTSLWTI